jgi:hypothetical protein
VPAAHSEFVATDVHDVGEARASTAQFFNLTERDVDVGDQESGGMCVAVAARDCNAIVRSHRERLESLFDDIRGPASMSAAEARCNVASGVQSHSLEIQRADVDADELHRNTPIPRNRQTANASGPEVD